MKKEVREPGLEPGSGRWQRPIVPLDHSRCIDGLHNLRALIMRENAHFWYQAPGLLTKSFMVINAYESLIRMQREREMSVGNRDLDV